ncbi:MAG: spermidine/putrescine ABC transporter substrate-binding protein, partial [Martelella sp.]
MRKLLCLSTALTLVFGATAPAFSADMKTEIGPGEGEVDIVAWAGYIESGETDAAYDWVSAFEEETGCMVNVKTAATSDEMV